MQDLLLKIIAIPDDLINQTCSGGKKRGKEKLDEYLRHITDQPDVNGII